MRVVRLERSLVVGILTAIAALLASVSVLLFALRPVPDVVVPSPAHRADWNDYDDRDVGGTSRCDVLSSAPLRIATFSSAAPGAFRDGLRNPQEESHNPQNAENARDEAGSS